MSGVSLTAAALDRLSAIARDAGRAIVADARSGVPCREKADRSPVTAADLAAERAIIEGLRAWDQTIPIVTEESSLPSAGDRAGWQRWWLVDPLDGTKEFLANNGEFTVNIALMADGDPVLGVVFAPALDLLYCAGRGLGSWRLSGACSPCPDPIARLAAGSAGASRGEPLTSIGCARSLSAINSGRRAYSPWQLAEILSSR